jgi:hypothetical protein
MPIILVGENHCSTKALKEYSIAKFNEQHQADFVSQGSKQGRRRTKSTDHVFTVGR